MKKTRRSIGNKARGERNSNTAREGQTRNRRSSNTNNSTCAGAGKIYLYPTKTRDSDGRKSKNLMKNGDIIGNESGCGKMGEKEITFLVRLKIVFLVRPAPPGGLRPNGARRAYASV